MGLKIFAEVICIITAAEKNRGRKQKYIVK